MLIGINTMDEKICRCPNCEPKTEKKKEEIPTARDRNNEAGRFQSFLQNWKLAFAFLYIIVIILQSVQNIVLSFVRRESNNLSQQEMITTLKDIYSVVNDTATYMFKK